MSYPMLSFATTQKSQDSPSSERPFSLLAFEVIPFPPSGLMKVIAPLKLRVP